MSGRFPGLRHAARRLRLAPLGLLVALLATSCASRGDGPIVSRNESGRLLAQVTDEVWAQRLASDPYLRLQEGLPVDFLPDPSHAAAEAQARRAEAWLARLAQVDVARLSEDEILTLESLRWGLERTVESLEFHWHAFQLTPYAGPFRGVHSILGSVPIRTPEDGRAYLGLLDDYVRLLGDLRDHLEEQERRGIRMPKDAVALVIPLLQGFAGPAESSHLALGSDRLATLDEDAATELQRQVAERIEERVNPALHGLAFHLAGEYERLAPEPVGVWQYPDGDRYYRFLIRLHTTLDLSPQEIHRLARRELDRLDEARFAVRSQVGFSQPSVEPFHGMLRIGPRFHGSDPEDVAERMNAAAEAMEPVVDQLFASRPAAPYAIERLAPSLEGGMTYGFYRPPIPQDPRGIYYFNGSRPKSRSLLGVRSLIFHELIPGHHFQLATLMESSRLHPLRKASITSFCVEGWAEYAAELGFELGLYEDSYDHYGRLSMDAFLTTRLLVDTGMNFYRWPRDKARRTMELATIESPTQIGTETLRYAVDIPGQALAYKLGSLKLWELRRRAEDELGEAFDPREFHRVVLAAGCVPWATLEAHVERVLGFGDGRSARR